MDNTINSAPAIHIDTRFDLFLFAAIGENKDGMRVTVLSALARLNFDPWRKAAELSQLSDDAAGSRLASLIAALPDLSAETLAPGTIDRLVNLLPRRAAAPAPRQIFGFGVLTRPGALIIYVTLMVVMIGAQHLWESNRVRFAAEQFRVPAPGAVLSSMPPAKADH